MLDGRGTLRELLYLDFSFGPFFTYDPKPRTAPSNKMHYLNEWALNRITNEIYEMPLK